MIFKVLLTVALIALVWFGFRYASKWLGGAGAAPGADKLDDGRPPHRVDDLTRCAVCETYVEAGGRAACDRDDCPMVAKS